MSQRPLPRYFVGRSERQTPGEVFPPDHVVDCFFVGARHLAAREWVVAVDAAGGLQTLPRDDGELSEAIQAELAYHEMSGGRGRLLEASECFLFSLELLEQPAGTPGWNDPVYLYGTLYGPCPAYEKAAGVEGQLAITRGDLLEGLIRSADHAFKYARPGAESAPPRCFHLTLPADREEEIRQGMGIVLAYPLLPEELILTDVSNEIVVKQLIYDTLIAIKEDLERERVAHPLRSMVIPVPSRFMLEQQLMAEGYSIRNGFAVKKAQGGEGFKGFLAGVFGSLMNDSLELPPEADVDEFLEIAGRVLNSLPVWPSPRAAALRTRVKPAPAEAHCNRRPAQPPQTRIPQPGEIRPRAPVRPIRQSDEPPDWMRDFIAAHHRPNAASPRLTSTLGVKKPAPSPKPEWMKDFE